MSGNRVGVSAQAKINLHLRVLAKEVSGFHSLETIFHRIDLADGIEIEITNGSRTIEVTGAETGAGEANLAFRAASAYADLAGWPAGFRIELTKNVPVAAGLGGGSADAAAVLRGLDYLSSRALSPAALAAIASSLGADVPFLAGDSVMALAWGHGERMLALDPLPSAELVLLVPDFGVSTVDAYRWVDEQRRGNPLGSHPLFLDLTQLQSWDTIAKMSVNDFEPPVIARHPVIGEAIEYFTRSGALLSRMSGSGSTVFGVMAGETSRATRPAELPLRVITTRTSTGVVRPRGLA